MFELIVALIAAIGGLLLKVKFDAHKMGNLKAKDAMHEKKEYINQEMDKVEKQEEAKADEAIKNIDTSNWRDNLK